MATHGAHLESEPFAKAKPRAETTVDVSRVDEEVRCNAEKLAIVRADELAKANEALRRSVERMSNERHLPFLLNSFLREAIEALGANGGVVMMRAVGEGCVFRTEAAFDGDVLTETQIRNHPYLGRFTEFSADDPDGMHSRLARGHSVNLLVGSPNESFPEAYAYHRGRGDRSIWSTPLRLREEVIGFFAIAHKSESDPTQSQRETIAALGQQLVLAIELARLAEESNRSAVLREREIAAQERAAELDRANQALRKGIAGLGRLDDLSHFLGEMLKAAVTTAGAHSGAVLLLDEVRHTYQVYPMLRVHGGFEPEGTELTSALPVSAGVKSFIREVNASTSSWIISETDDRMDPQFVAFHKVEGNVAVAHIPMRVEDRLIGLLGLGFPTADPQCEKEFGLLRSLADQMTLAVEMVRLSNEAKSAAVAREREKAARERAEELELANQALRNGIAGLGQLNDLSHFLGEMLKAAAFTAGAQGAAVNLIDHATRTWKVSPLLRATGHLEPFDSELCQPQPMTSGIRSIFDEIEASTTAWITQPEARMGPLYLDFHQKEGNRTIAHIPMRSGDQLIGLLGLGFSESHVEFGKEFALLRSLADQMTLAVEMVRMSEEAKSAAVAKERERAAQHRAAELERVNQLLREGAQALALARTPDEIFELFLLQAMNAVQGTGGGLLEVVKGTEHRFVALAQGGKIVSKAEWEHLPIVARNKEITTRDQSGVMARLLQGEDIWFPVDEEFAAWAPESAEYHWRLGNVALVLWPFYVGNVVRGNIGIAFSHTNPLTAMQRETLKALSSQASLALELSAMTTKVEAAAIAREREAAAQTRAAELGRANEELSLRDRLLTASAKALEQLISSTDFSSGVLDALRQIGKAAGLSRVQVLMETTLPSGLPAHELVYEWWAEGLVSQKGMGLLLFPDADQQEVLDRLQKGERWWARTEDWPKHMQPAFRELNIAWSGVVPIFVQQHYVGLVAFDQCDETLDWSEAEIDALTIAAQGIGAALSQQQMSAQLVSEREQAAQDRAAELVKANHALRCSVDDLVTQTTTDGILTSLLKQAINISGANSGAILRRVGGSEFEYVTIYANGAFRSSQAILAAGTNTEMRFASRLDPTGHFAGLARGEMRWRAVEEPILGVHLKRSTKFHREAGNRCIYDFPYQVSGQVFGFLGLAFAGAQPPTETIQETIKALATQVGLALEFRRISEQVERAAILEERGKFARDLHDTLAQGFTAILIQLGAADQSGPIPKNLLPYLDRIDNLARKNLAEARKTVTELRTSERVREPLVERLDQLARQLESVYSNWILLDVTGTPRTLPPVVEDEMYLIAQEAVTNALKHAEAGEVKVEVQFKPDGLKLKVKDNGKGFSSEERGKVDHFGLQTMQERSQRISARLTIISEPGFGSEILTFWSDTPAETQ